MKALIAVDEDTCRKTMDAIMRRLGYQTVICHDGLTALDAVSDNRESPQLVLLDWEMPGMSGVDVVRRIRSRDASAAYPYVILVSGKDRREDVIEGLEAGADDYVTKPINYPEFQARVASARRILEQQSMLIATSEKLRTAATHDALTGVWNRTAILEILARELVRAEREARAIGVVMADIDYFKSINDSLGHLAGDGVLREAASRIAGCARPYDSIGRYGGEEFLIVLPGCTAVNALVFAERMRCEFANRPFAAPSGRIAATISLGVTVLRSGIAGRSLALIAEADAALYRAKHAGRNRVVFAESSHAAECDQEGPLPRKDR